MLKIVSALLVVLLPAVSMAQETLTFVDDRGREVDVPADPQRIVSLDDLRLTVPLLELGVVPVASHGREGDAGPYIRAAKLVTGIDFDNSDIEFVGSDISAEAVLNVEPDLIVVYGGRDELLDQLEMIAPTVVLDPTADDYMGVYQKLAELTNTEDTLARLQMRYEAQLDQLRALIDTSAITVSVITASEGAMTVPHTFGSLGIAVRDAGFRVPALMDSLDLGTEIQLSAERIDEIDADLVIDSYRSDRGETPEAADERMREVFPQYCEALWACRNGQFVRLPREEFYAISYYGLTASIYTLTALISAQEFTLRESE